MGQHPKYDGSGDDVGQHDPVKPTEQNKILQNNTRPKTTVTYLARHTQCLKSTWAARQTMVHEPPSCYTTTGTDSERLPSTSYWSLSHQYQSHSMSEAPPTLRHGPPPHGCCTCILTIRRQSMSIPCRRSNNLAWILEALDNIPQLHQHSLCNNKMNTIRMHALIPVPL